MSRILTRSRPAALALGLVLLAARPAVTQTAAAQSLSFARAEEVGMSSERLERLSARMREHIAAEHIAGAVTLVARAGRVVHLEAHGFRNREEGVPMEVDDIFVIMSMTKPITATALMMLFEEGKLLLNDPISKWLPEFAGMQVRVPDGNGGFRLEPARPITVRHVLTHTVGITGQGGGAVEPHPGDSPLRARVRRFTANPLSFQPGERWQYTDAAGLASDVVAALVEVISGQNMDDFLRERIFTPLGMHDTHYNVPEEKWERRARLYQPQREDGWRIVPQPVTRPQPTQLFLGLAGLSSTAADYFRFAQMVMNGGEYGGVRLLSPKTVSLMTMNHIADGIPVNVKGPGYGFGLGYSVLLDPALASEALSPGSYGWEGAWGTYYVNDPVEELVAILLVQVSPYRHLTIRDELANLATQAIVEAKGSGERKIRGYPRFD